MCWKISNISIYKNKTSSKWGGEIFIFSYSVTMLSAASSFTQWTSTENTTKIPIVKQVCSNFKKSEAIGSKIWIIWNNNFVQPHDVIVLLLDTLKLLKQPPGNSCLLTTSVNLHIIKLILLNWINVQLNWKKTPEFMEDTCFSECKTKSGIDDIPI